MFDGDIKWSEYSYISPTRIKSDVVLYPLLLQRGIEGINKESFNKGSQQCPVRILIDIDKFKVVNNKTGEWRDFYFSARMDYDRAKEETLLFIYSKRI